LADDAPSTEVRPHAIDVIWIKGSKRRQRTVAAFTRGEGALPRLVCWSCGRQIYTVAPLESLFAEERRCPRCGAFLNADRREEERRTAIRRQNPEADPGPPSEAERRLDQRRKQRRRRPVDGSGPVISDEDLGSTV
jgi:hypothetical protein